MQLSDQQIEHLFRFTEKKLVHWYDLQVELVDHLAARIEEEMQADTSLSFESALEKVYAGFGIFGFSKIVQAKQVQLERAARKIWWSEVRAFFTWPKAVLLVLIASILWQLSVWVDPDVLMVCFAGAYIVARLCLLIYAISAVPRKRKLLLLQYGPLHSSLAVFVYEVVILARVRDLIALEFCIAAVIGILILAASFQLYFQVRHKAEKLYPEAFRAA